MNTQAADVRVTCIYDIYNIAYRSRSRYVVETGDSTRTGEVPKRFFPVVTTV